MRYHFYTDGKRKVICVTTFAKKPVKGVAVCAEGDTFDLEKGKALAKARCDYYFGIKRLEYARERFNTIADIYSQVNRMKHEAMDYLNDCEIDRDFYAAEYGEIFDKMMETNND